MNKISGNDVSLPWINPLEYKFISDIIGENGGNHLSEAEVFDLFCKHQVFEKILIQHETLHQLDTTETFQYVEEIIKEDAPELALYHGSNIVFEKIDLAKSHNRRDFGRGFYCTVLETQAEEWARRLYLRSRQGGRYVYRYLCELCKRVPLNHILG